MPSTSIAAVCLDAGGTLLHSDPAPPVIYAEHLRRHGRPVSKDEAATAFRKAWEQMQRRTAPGVDRYTSLVGGEYAWWGAFVRAVLAELQHDAPWEPLLDDLYASFSRADIWRIYPDVLPALTALRCRGVALAVISNWDRRLLQILDDLELTPYFTTVSVSNLEGIEKPDAEIFLRTLRRLAVPPSGSIHVGDSPHDDYCGAAAAGLTPLLIDRTGAHAGKGYRTIASLHELLDLVADGSLHVAR